MKDLVIAQVNILPLGTGTASVSSLVADCVNVIKDTPGLNYKITPMATIIEGPIEKILDAVKKMHEVPFSKGVARVVTNITIDDRRDKEITMDYKVKAVEEKM